jgi:hypothetical protein
MTTQKKTWQMTREEFNRGEIFYHGTKNDFNEFNLDNMGKGAGTMNIPGVYLTQNKELADIWGRGGKVLEVRVPTGKEYHMDLEDLITLPVDEEGYVTGDIENVFTKEKGKVFVEDLKAKGYTKIVIDAVDDATDEKYVLQGEFNTPQYIILNPKDIKISGKHKNIVQQALSEGKPVPPEVLKDYPDLQKQYPQPSPDIKEYTPEEQGVIKQWEDLQGAIKEIKDKSGLLTDDLPSDVLQPLVKDSEGNVIGHVTDNGRVFRGRPEEEAYKTEKPLYDSRTEKPEAPKVKQRKQRIKDTLKPKVKDIVKTLQSQPVQSKSAPDGIKSLENIHARRSPQARALDEAQKHSLTLSHGDKRTERWKFDQGAADVRGIDTFRLRTPKMPSPRKTKAKIPSSSMKFGKMYVTKLGRTGMLGFSRHPIKGGKRK